MANYLKPPPSVMPYPVLQDALHRSTLIQKSDPMYATDASTGGGTTALFTLPAGTLVLRAWMNILTGTTGASKLSIGLGDTDGAYRFYGLTGAAGAAGAVTILSTGTGFYNPVVTTTGGLSTGNYAIKNVITSTPRLYDTDFIIYGTMTALTTDMTQGKVEFYVEYLPYADALPWSP